MKHMAHVSVELSDGRWLLLAVHDANAPSNEEWDWYLDEVKSLQPKTNNFARYLGLVVTDGGAPNALQRRSIATYLEVKAIRGAAVTDNILVRGAVTALRWINPNLRSFSPIDFDQAMKHLCIPPVDVDAIRKCVAETAKKVPWARTARLLTAGVLVSEAHRAQERIS